MKEQTDLGLHCLSSTVCSILKITIMVTYIKVSSLPSDILSRSPSTLTSLYLRHTCRGSLLVTERANLIPSATMFPVTIWKKCNLQTTNEPVHEIMVLTTYVTSEGSGEPAHPRSLIRAFAVRTHKVWK